jgi:hypothetical protein
MEIPRSSIPLESMNGVLQDRGRQPPLCLSFGPAAKGSKETSR